MYTLNSTEVHAVCYAIDHVVTGGGNCTAQGKCWYEQVCPTLKGAGVHAVFYDARGNGGGGVCPTITGDHQDRITDYTAIVLATPRPPTVDMPLDLERSEQAAGI